MQGAAEVVKMKSPPRKKARFAKMTNWGRLLWLFNQADGILHLAPVPGGEGLGVRGCGPLLCEGLLHSLVPGH